ncbi:diguanylate cyclase [Psychromonas aquatilis]|uniref:diguanylate cyclase n=1 Tax=Psychromonas aquatilis TaxID=2005072 RepID=A0ABU9GMM9_9GAMM
MHQKQLSDIPVVNNKLNWQRVTKRFLAFYTFIAVILAASIYTVFKNYTNNLEKKIMLHEEVFIASTKQSLQTEIQTQLRVMEMTTKSPLFARFIEKPSQQNREHLSVLFKNLSSTFTRFNQVRLLSLDGLERIRVDYDDGQARVIPQEGLQDKQKRNYYKESKTLKVGEVFISAIELNEEHGQIEIPYKPVIRFVTLINDSHNKPAGYFVINYLATDLLNDFRAKMKLRIEGQGMLIDPQGYWISNHQRSNEWGGSLPDVEYKFEDLYPEAWETVRDNESGLFKTDKGLFRHVSIKPFGTNSISQKTKDEQKRFHILDKSKKINDWKLIIFLPNGVIEEASFFYAPAGRVILTALFVFTAAILLLLLILQEQKRRKYTYDALIKDQLTDLYENAPCGYHSLDKNGTIIKINKTELEWLGYTKEEVLGKNFASFLTPKSKETFTNFLISLKSQSKIEGVVLEIQCKQNHTFFVSTSATSISGNGHFAVARTSSFNITDRIILERKLAYIANTDELTNMSNRRHFFKRAEPEFASEKSLYLFMIDADHFKHINDQYGHDVGDNVLKMIAKTMQSSLSEAALKARLGGEEFVVLLPDVNADEAYLAAEKLRAEMENSITYLANSEQEIKITISIGVAARRYQSESIDEVLKHADEALYTAKSTGRNKVIFAKHVIEGSY